MSADISRARFDPLRDFAGVVLQQGRLLLDADFNELVALLDRRLRAETCDLTSFGPDPDQSGVAWVPRQTPDGFRVTLSGGGLSIGRGRMYVDGLLAENHGIERDGFDPLLSERTGTLDTPYLQQPYWQTPDPLPTTGTYLAYLDVWQREVTHLEDPGLVEIAVGVDTTARWQTAWQVRLLEAEGVSCTTDDEDIDGWPELTAPSDGRLTTGTVEVADEDDPCELPPLGGYRGLENQTYRVEIHDAGEPGEATFKWSRENASVVLPVTEMVSSTVLRLASVGKDDVLRVSTGDWVEILDDRFELDGRLGELRKVTVDDAERTIAFSGALDPDLQPANAEEAAARHLRVRRWDQSGVVRDGTGAQLEDLDAAGASGLITVPAAATTQVVLEHGVAVSFSVAAAAGRFRQGDYWIVAARTADASIELFDAAPPLGVHHHYARLGVLDFATGAESDCRRLWPPLPTEGGGEGCDCTVCVTPESHKSKALTLQAAIEIVKERGGGTICLDVGVYDLGDGVDIEGVRSLRIRGQGPATILTARGEALAITRSIAITVENLAVVSGAGGAAAIRLQNVLLADLHELVVLSYGSRDLGGSAIALAGVGLLLGLRRNVLVAPVGIGVQFVNDVGLLGAALRIEDNLVLASQRGIDLGGPCAYFHGCRVAGNDVLGASELGISASGAVAPGGSLDVTGNKVSARGAGIVVGADATVDQNTVNTLGEERGTDGIVVDAPGIPVEPGHVRITGNRVHGRAGGGIVLRTAVRTFMVKQNVLAGVGYGIAMEPLGKAERTAIDNNEVFDVAAREGPTGIGVGILVSNAGAAAVVGNTVARVGADVDSGGLAGIVVIASEDVRVSGNVVDGVGAEEGGFSAAGIAVFGPFERASVSDNSSRFRAGRLAPTDGRWWALLVQAGGRSGGGAISNEVGAPTRVVPLDDGAVVVGRAFAFAVAARGGHAGIASNTLSGGGREPACIVLVGGDVVAEGNQCLHAQAEKPSAVVLGGSSVIASSNRLRGDRAMLIIQTQENRLAAVGNLAPGGTHLNSPGAGIPGPWQSLNPQVA